MNSFRQMLANVAQTRDAFAIKATEVNQSLNQSTAPLLLLEDEALSTDELATKLLQANLTETAQLLQTTLNIKPTLTTPYSVINPKEDQPKEATDTTS